MTPYWLPPEPVKRFDGHKPPVDINTAYDSHAHFVQACELIAWYILTGKVGYDRQYVP